MTGVQAPVFLLLPALVWREIHFGCNFVSMISFPRFFRHASRSTILALAGVVVSTEVPAQRPAAVDTKAILADLDRYIPKALAEWNGAGLAIAIVKDDAVIYARGFGVRERGKPDPVDDQTIFAIGSNTKFFTAVVAGMLQDDGKLRLTDRVTTHLPNFQTADMFASRKMTLRDMMSHRTGMSRGDALWYSTSFDRAEVLRRARYLPQQTSFRSAFGYNNIMFLGVGQACAAAAGMSWDDLIARRIFQPLGMTASSTSIRNIPKGGNVATPHTYVNGNPKPIAFLDVDNIGPAGSINSTAQDMAKWMRFILAGGKTNGQQLLEPATLAELTSPQSISPFAGDSLDPSRHFTLYAQGVMIIDMQGVKVLQHTGGVDGMLSSVSFVPERQLGVVVLTNTFGHNNLYTALPTRVLNAFLGGPDRDWSAIALAQMNQQEARALAATTTRLARRTPNTSPSRPLEQYAGTYRSEIYGEATVSVENGALRIRYERAVNALLAHFHFDTFLMGDPDEDGGVGTSLVQFRLDPLARVVAVDVPSVGEFRK